MATKTPSPRKRGRPSMERDKFTTTLPPGYAARLKAIGKGNASAAIVRLVEDFEMRTRQRN